MDITTKFRKLDTQQVAFSNLIYRINYMSGKNRAMHYNHFCQLASMAAEHLPDGESLSVFDDIAALFYNDNIQDHDIQRPATSASA